MSPYEETWYWIAANSSTEGARGLAKLLLSLWQPTAFAFPFATCVDKLDETCTELALRVVIHYSNFEDEAELREVGAKLQEQYPELRLSGRTAAAVMSSATTRGSDGRVHRQYTLANEADADELDAAWQEIVTQQQRPRTAAVARETEQVVERAREGLQVIVGAMQDHPGTGQGRRLVRFVAGMYNGSDYPFDLSDLRALDRRLSNACLDYLTYDVLGKQEVHRHLPGAEASLHRWLRSYHIRPTAQLKREIAERLAAMAVRQDRHVGALLNDTIESLVNNDEANRFVGLEPHIKASEDDDLVHLATRPAGTVAGDEIQDHLSPLCGNPRGPWKVKWFYNFERISCPDCLKRMLFPDYEDADGSTL